MQKILSTLILALLFTPALFAASDCPPDKAVPEGFISLFDGKTLDGWDADPKFWTVENGCITGRSTLENPVAHNSFLILRKVEKPQNFTLIADFKMSPQCNSGCSFRAAEIKSEPWRILGTHADIFDHQNHMATFYRDGVMAWRGQDVTVKPGSPRKIEVTKQLATPAEMMEKIDMYGWNTFKLYVNGNRYELWINGVLMSAVTDESLPQQPEGVLGFQMHQGPPMVIQFRNVFFKNE